MRTIMMLSGMVACSGATTVDPTTTASPTTATTGPCSDDAALDAVAAAHTQWFEATTADVPARPVTTALTEDTNGTLRLGLQGDARPILAGASGVHVAAATMGTGRVVAFSGQDFLSSGTRSTLLGDPGVTTLLRNARDWVAGEGDGDLVLRVANDAVGGLLTEGSSHSFVTAGIVEQQGLREIRDWSAGSLAGADVLVVQINEWGTLMVADSDLDAIRTFVEEGGGLMIAGSALHWSWWLSDQGPAFPGDALLADVGLGWTRSSVRDMTSATLAADPLASPARLWCAYARGDEVPDDMLAQVGPLFADAAAEGRDDEVQRALTRLIDEAPALPARADSGAARLAADVGVDLVGVAWPAPHPWAATFPGDVAPTAKRRLVAASVDTSWKRVHPVGAYAAPGSVVTLEVPRDHARSGLGVRIGNLYDDLRPIDSIDEWRRAPSLRQERVIDGQRITVGSGLGGPISIVVPDDYPAASFQITLHGVVPMALYTHTESTEDDFFATLDEGAPQAVIQERGGVAITVDAGEAAKADPSDVMDFWGTFIDAHEALAQEPVPRPFVSHWLFDPQVGFGYANATSLRINHPQVAEPWALRLTPDSEVDWWLFGHELGHQFQTADWTGGDVTEVCVNLWTMYTLNAIIEGGDDFESATARFGPVDHAALDGAQWGDADLFGKLQLYRQIVDGFGWTTMQAVMASYYDPAYPRETHGSFMDGFALRTSAITGRDITPFLDRWDYPLSDEARDRVQTWALPDWLPPGW